MNTESNRPISTTPPLQIDQLLQEKFAEEIVKQSDRLDELAKQLFTLELAVPGGYATVLQLVQDKVTISQNKFFLWSALICWTIALSMTLWGWFPKRYKVLPQVIHRERSSPQTEGLSIEEYYEYSARDKRRLLAIGSILFFLGVISALIAIF